MSSRLTGAIQLLNVLPFCNGSCCWNTGARDPHFRCIPMRNAISAEAPASLLPGKLEAFLQHSTSHTYFQKAKALLNKRLNLVIEADQITKAGLYPSQTQTDSE